MHALAEPHRRPAPRILEPANVVDPRPGGVDDRARAGTSTVSPSTAHLAAGETRPTLWLSATTSAPLSTVAPASAAARTFARQSRLSFVHASA